MNIKEIFIKINKINLEKIAKTCLYILIFLTPLFFLPLTIFPVEINKQMLALVLVFIAFLCYLIQSLNRRTIIYPKTLLSLAVLAILAVAGVSAIFSQTWEISFWGNFSQTDALLNFLIYGLTFFLAAVFFKKNDLVKIGLCFLASIVLLAILGLLQLFGKFINFNPVGSIFSWGIIIAFGLAMIVAALINLKLSQKLKIILSLMGLLMFAALIVINFQLIWLELALVMVLLLIPRFITKADMTLPLIIIIVSLFFVLINQQWPALINIPVEVRPSFSTTLAVAQGVLTGRQVLTGTGPATFGFYYTRFRPVELNQTVFWPIRFNQGFSFLTTLLPTLGVLGIAAFLFLLIALIFKSFKIWRDERNQIILTGVVFLLINWFFYPASFTQLIFVFLGLGLLVSDSVRSFGLEFYQPNKWRNIRNFLVFLGIVILLSFSLFFLYAAGRKYAAAIYYGKSAEPAYLGKAVNLNPQSDLYLRAASQVWIAQAKEQNQVVSAVNAGRRAAEVNPIDSLNWSNLGNIYENLIPITQADVFAEENYRKAMELDPQSPQSPVDVARALMIQNKLDQAKTLIDKSISLKSDYTPAHFLLAQIYLREGKSVEAREQLEIVEKLNPNNQEVKKILDNLRSNIK